MNVDQRLSRYVRIGRLRADASGLFDIVTETPRAIQAQTYNAWLPEYRGYSCDWSKQLNVQSVTTNVQEVVVGLLHSFQGNLSRITRESQFFGEWIAIQEINSNGGVLGLPIRTRLLDGSTAAVEAAQAVVAESSLPVVFGVLEEANQAPISQV